MTNTVTHESMRIGPEIFYVCIYYTKGCQISLEL